MLSAGSAPQMVDDCALTLSNVTREKEIHALLIEEGAVKLLVKLAEVKRPATQRNVALGMSNLTQQSTLRRRIVEEGIVPALLHLSKSELEETRVSERSRVWAVAVFQVLMSADHMLLCHQVLVINSSISSKNG